MQTQQKYYALQKKHFEKTTKKVLQVFDNKIKDDIPKNYLAFYVET